MNIDIVSILECADRRLSYLQDKKHTMAEKMLVSKKEIAAHLLIQRLIIRISEYFCLYLWLFLSSIFLFGVILNMLN